MNALDDIPPRTGMTVAAFKQDLLDNLFYTLGKDTGGASTHDYYMALAYTVRDRLIQRWLQTQQTYATSDAKTVYYLSAEYLLGRQLSNNLLSLDLTEVARQAVAELGQSLEAISEAEVEPGLGNGGLGRLAACFLDSLATLDLPAVGYGIRYEFGIFQQTLADGWQVEQPDDWLACDYPWEFACPLDTTEVWFGGTTEAYVDAQGRYRVCWNPDTRVAGVPYTMLVPGYRNDTVNSLRLWHARAPQTFDLAMFDAGDYLQAVEKNVRAETITKVLYPDDSTPQGKQLRLQQQYFFVACSLREILQMFRARHDDWDLLPEQVTIQLNDTHPAIAVAELMRLLVDEELLPWEQAWAITARTIASTQHTLMPEAMEEWPIGLFARLLPRHMEIVYEINRRFLDRVRTRWPDDPDRVARLSIIREQPEKRVRMAHLACVGSYSINGVAALQSDLLKERALRDFFDLWPERFNNKTNGVSPRRFLRLANPPLAALITAKLGNEWLTDLDQLARLEAYADDPAFRAAWRTVKQCNKLALADDIHARLGIAVDAGSLYDVMAKRLHEYKRQLLKVLHIITLYDRLTADPDSALAPRTFIFGAKAAPGYRMAKLIIKLINNVATVVNQDPAVRDRLRVVFLPNFNVSVAERLYPAADISEQISLAGTEASGTGNMKFALSGALTVGTLDGANIEIRERVGADNFFLFGLTTQEVLALRAAGYRPWDYYERDPELKRAIDRIADGDFAAGDRDLFAPIVASLLSDDPYLDCADYRAYVDCAESAACAYQDTEAWTRASILNSARCGFFSSDRAIRQYSEEIWRLTPVPVTLSDKPRIAHPRRTRG